MSVNVKVNMFKTSGKPSKVKVFTYRENDAFILPTGSMVLYSEYVPSEDCLEVWAAVPDDSIIHSGSPESMAKRININGEPVQPPTDKISLEEIEDGVFKLQD